MDDLSTELELLVRSVYEDDPASRVLYFDGEKVKNARAGNEEIAVNECCFVLYPFAPEVNNEMVNRAVIRTVQTKKARLNIIQAILSHTDTPDFYSGSHPPQLQDTPFVFEPLFSAEQKPPPSPGEYPHHPH